MFTDTGVVPDDPIWHVEHVDDVANLLRKQGIKGQPSICWTCPIAKYFTKVLEVPKGFLISAEPFNITLRAGLFGGVIWKRKIGLDHPISEFIMSFDLRQYADLIEEGY